jgi:rod shape-determining protein MreD
MNLMLPEIIFTVVTTLLIYRIFLMFNRHLEEIEKRGDSSIV